MAGTEGWKGVTETSGKDPWGQRIINMGVFAFPPAPPAAPLPLRLPCCAVRGCAGPCLVLLFIFYNLFLQLILKKKKNREQSNPKKSMALLTVGEVSVPISSFTSSDDDGGGNPQIVFTLPNIPGHYPLSPPLIVVQPSSSAPFVSGVLTISVISSGRTLELYVSPSSTYVSSSRGDPYPPIDDSSSSSSFPPPPQSTIGPLYRTTFTSPLSSPFPLPLTLKVLSVKSTSPVVANVTISFPAPPPAARPSSSCSAPSAAAAVHSSSSSPLLLASPLVLLEEENASLLSRVQALEEKVRLLENVKTEVKELKSMMLAMAPLMAGALGAGGVGGRR